MFNISPSQLALELGIGLIIGGFIGYTTKKIARHLAFLIGLQLVVFKFLESRGVVIVNWDKLSGKTTTTLSGAQTPPSWLMTLLSTLAVGAGFAIGFFIGFRRA